MATNSTIASYLQLSGTNVTNCSGGANGANGGNGQGVGAFGASEPQRQYALTLSLSSRTIKGVTYSSTCQLTTVVKDVNNNTIVTATQPTYKSYCVPSVLPAWYNPQPAAAAGGSAAYTAQIASISSGGLITANSIGQVIIEAQFPYADRPTTWVPASPTGNPQESFIYSQIVLTVVA